MELAQRLRHAGIAPSRQRLAVAEHVLATRSHPSADQVFAVASHRLPGLSRATVYNTLNLLVAKGLLKQLVLSEGRAVFDAVTTPHHHFIDVDTGTIYDVPWEALQVGGVDRLANFVVSEHQVVLRGRIRPGKR
jgi:Fe2+ or Zn2+ uptake regulation protein